WQDARELYKITWDIFKEFPFELKRVASNQIASVDSVHRNIAEGYCRKSITEYLNFLNIAKSSLGESVSGSNIYNYSNHISNRDYENWDSVAYKIENGLKRLIEKLELKRYDGTWNDSTMLEESNTIY
ncbi:MAG TPA: four helix bundle protein, partial [Bacteroidales bacterium]|nr:four helix bundle protein [Bacteroidales bacterium]